MADFVCYYGPTCCACVGCDDDAAIVDAADDCGAGGGGFGEGNAFGVQGEVSVVVGEVEARHSASIVLCSGLSSMGEIASLSMG